MWARAGHNYAIPSYQILLCGPLSCWITVLLSGCDAWTRAQGTIRDSAGKPIPDANVTLKIDSASQQIHSDNEGHYVVQISQPPWEVDCTLTAIKAGFIPYEKQLKGPGIYKDLLRS